MQKITTFLMFNDQAEAAVNLYTSVFKNSKIVNIHRAGPGPTDAVMSATFQLEGQQFMAFNGGPTFKFSEGISLFVNCETQAEIDELWAKLSDGGAPGRCGWLKDRFGVSWQIIPSVLGQLLGNPDAEKAKRALNAMLQMGKLDIAKLEAA
jgi:predicted 3-demethylubiquinone-9 3-methyltransferase (glyoxalase superfamily)